MYRTHLSRCRLVGAWLCFAGCTYDLDKVFSYTGEDAGAQDAGPTPLPDDLIDLWPAGALSDECIACAKDKCGEVNTICREDAECADFTRCIAAGENPVDQYDCRADHVNWLSHSIAERDIGGPYQQCVLLSRCGSECDSHNQLACTKHYNWPTTDVAVPLHLRFVEGLNSDPVAGLKVRACRAEDTAQCLPADGPTYTTDDDGVVHLEVQPSLGSFQGYLELTGAGMYPTLLRFGWPIARELVTNTVVVSAQNVNLLVASTGATIAPDRGLLQLRAFGCNGISMRDISFAVSPADAQASTWYTVGQDPFPNFEVTSTADRGAGGISNVQAGRRRVTASRDGELISSLSAPVRGGYMTIVVFLPGDSSLQ
jgi:hypothetical protein